MRAVRGLILTIRPHQWVKNIFVAAPLVFSKRLTDVPTALRALAAVGCFCLASGAVYLVNDVLDIEKDRAHPTKRRRPIPAGELGAQTAVAAAGVLAIGSILGATLLAPLFGLVTAVYLVIFLAYSLRVKEIAFLDVTSLAAGFLLRVLGGAYAIHVEPSPWLLACTALLAAFLGFGKRAHELRQAMTADPDARGKTRAVLTRYRLDHLKLALYGLGAATVASYGFYTQSAHTVAFFGTRHMIWTLPFCAIGLARFLWLVLRENASLDSPTDAMLRDGPFLANFGAWGAVVLAIIYKLI